MEHLGSGNIRNKPSSTFRMLESLRVSVLVSGVGSGGPQIGYRLRLLRLPVAVACGRRKTTFQNVVLLGMSKWCLINAKKRYIYMYYTTRWWQLKYVSNFHLENWGRWFPIWRAYFSKGLKPPTRWCFFLDDDIWAFTLQNGGGNWKKNSISKWWQLGLPGGIVDIHIAYVLVYNILQNDLWSCTSLRGLNPLDENDHE